MIQHCPVLIVLLPLTAALLCLLFSKFNKNLGSWLVIGSIAGSLACSLQVLHQTLTSGEAIHYWMGNFGCKSTHFSLQPGCKSCIQVALTTENQQKEGGPRLQKGASSAQGRLAAYRRLLYFVRTFDGGPVRYGHHR